MTPEDHAAITSACQEFRTSLDQLDTAVRDTLILKGIGLSIFDHLHQQLTAAFPDIAVPALRAHEITIIRGVYLTLQAIAEQGYDTETPAQEDSTDARAR
jgi:hypothetical protein